MQRPDALGLTKGESVSLRLLVSLIVPDQDITRVHATVRAQRGEPGSPLPGTAEMAADHAVQTLVEPLRSLGGEANAAAVKVEVRCVVSLR
jgi:hypothetical protein